MSDQDSSVRSSFDLPTAKEGYLQKKGQLLKGWKRRWFVCDGKTLSYYTSHKDKKPNIVIPLVSCTVQDGGTSETWNSPRIYLTDGTNGTMYCLSAEDGHVVSEWLSVLQNAVYRLKGSTERSSTGEFDVEVIEDSPSASRTMINRSPKARSKRRSMYKSSSKKLPTNLKLENELSSAFQKIESLMRSRNAFKVLGVRDGVHLSTYNTEGKIYVRGSVVINAPPDMVVNHVTDISRRKQWDAHFPTGSVVASYGSSTEMVYLTSDEVQVGSSILRDEITPYVAGAIGLAAAGTMITPTSAYSIGIDPLSSFLCGTSLGILASSFDIRRWCSPRDLLLIKHTKENSDGSYLVVEKSIVNELKPRVSGVIRAEIEASGFVIQLLGVDDDHEPEPQTLLTYITTINLHGFISKRVCREFLINRVMCLANIRESVLHNRVFSDNLEYEDSSKNKIANQEDNQAFDSMEEASEIAEWSPGNWNRGTVRVPTGGLKITDKEVVKKQKGVLREVLKSFGATILEGKSAVSLSLPIRVFEPRSMLERLANLWLYAPSFLSRATVNNIDPLERFKLVIAFAVGGLHFSVGLLKPFNPILGETFQTELDDGTTLCFEHTSHHPPISNFLMNGKNFTLWGYFVIGGGFKTNAITLTQTGPVRVDFSDGSRISYTMPYLRNGGFLWGDRVMEILGSMEFTDEKNNLFCELRFNPDEKKGMGGMFSTSKTPTDHCRGTITRSNTNEEICEVSGSWLDELKFGDEVYWDINRDTCSACVRLPNVLPSDCRYREDLVNLKNGDSQEAQEWKYKLEKLQRADRAKRSEGRASRGEEQAH